MLHKLHSEYTKGQTYLLHWDVIIFSEISIVKIKIGKQKFYKLWETMLKV